MPPRHSSSSNASGKTATAPPPRRVRVLLPLPLDRAYDYLDELEPPLKEGDFVRVPFAGRERTGCVWSCDPTAEGTGGEAVDAKKLKQVIARRDAPPLPADIARFIDWASRRTRTSIRGPMIPSAPRRCCVRPASKIATMTASSKGLTASRSGSS